ncbi:MAG: radical SAM protein [Clostridiales bacterium]|nr:radical SAM protein [Clostridiales bacterium]
MKYFMNNSYELLQMAADCSDNMLCPQKLYLDVTQDCNLWCKMCRDKSSVCGRTMPMELFCRIVDETAPYVRSYSLFNWGEPLLLNDLRERVRYVNLKKRADCHVELSTNGMLLEPDFIEFFAEEKVELIISVDGADKSTFESIRRGADFERVMRNAETAVRFYEDFPAHRSPSFYISVQKDNERQVAEIFRLAFSLGIRRVGCGIVTAPSFCVPEQNEALCHELETAYRFACERRMFLDVYPTKVGDYVFADGKYRPASQYIVNTVCHAPLVSAAIDYAGDVYLCCNGGARVGNLSGSGFLEMWQSEPYHRLRHAVNCSWEMSERCGRCAWVNRN